MIHSHTKMGTFLVTWLDKYAYIKKNNIHNTDKNIHYFCACNSHRGSGEGRRSWSMSCMRSLLHELPYWNRCRCSSTSVPVVPEQALPYILALTPPYRHIVCVVVNSKAGWENIGHWRAVPVSLGEGSETADMLCRLVWVRDLRLLTCCASWLLFPWLLFLTWCASWLNFPSERRITCYWRAVPAGLGEGSDTTDVLCLLVWVKDHRLLTCCPC